MNDSFFDKNLAPSLGGGWGRTFVSIKYKVLLLHSYIATLAEFPNRQIFKLSHCYISSIFKFPNQQIFKLSHCYISSIFKFPNRQIFKFSNCYINTLLHWYINTLVHWFIDTLKSLKHTARKKLYF